MRKSLHISIFGFLAAWWIGCASLPVVAVPSQNQNSRIQYLVLHFTSESFGESMRLLTQRTERPVSAHYLVPEPGDPTYPAKKLKIQRLVPEDRRAWHAGRSYWAGKLGLNDASIGIEIVNRSHCTNSDPGAQRQTPEMQTCTFLDFSEEQMELVIGLVQDILKRHPEIDPVDIVGHSDIAPARRSDPGPTFPWKRLHDLGIGAWPDDETVLKYLRRFEREPPTVDEIRQGLRVYGYRVYDDEANTRFAVRAFQLHFRPSRIDGRIDTETAAVLFALLEKYRPGKLVGILG